MAFSSTSTPSFSIPGLQQGQQASLLGVACPPANSQIMVQGCIAKLNAVCAAVSLVLVLIYEGEM